MGLFDKLMETFSDAPEWKGKRFEKFIIDKFSDKYFNIVEQTHSWKTNQERFVESSINPDYVLRYKPTKEEFAVECKYRSRLNPRTECEGWDLNPRTPARSGPEPDAVDRAWLPSRLYTLYMKLHKDRGSRLLFGVAPIQGSLQFPVAKLIPLDLS